MLRLAPWRDLVWALAFQVVSEPLFVRVCGVEGLSQVGCIAVNVVW
jgi:hypothetical protein